MYLSLAKKPSFFTADRPFRSIGETGMYLYLLPSSATMLLIQFRSKFLLILLTESAQVGAILQCRADETLL